MSARQPSADVVVVGAGVIGAACACALSAAGLRVTILERDGLAAGTSRACQSGIGFGLDMDDYELAWSLASNQAYRDLAAQGADIDYVPCGALIVDEPGEEERLKLLIRRAQKLGADCRWVSRSDLIDLEPEIAPDLDGGALLPGVAHVSPMKVVRELINRAVRAGANVLTGTELLGIDAFSGRVRGAITRSGYIATPKLVLAAGVWSKGICTRIGLDIPLRPLKGHVIVTEPLDGLVRHYVSEAGYGPSAASYRFNPMDGAKPAPSEPAVATVIQSLPSGSLLIGSSREFAGFDRDVNRQTVTTIAGRARRFVPALGDVTVLRVYAGLRPLVADGRPLVGTTAHCEGLIFATGHGGDGNTGALMTGSVIADLVCGHEPAFDVSPLAPDRFRLSGRS